MMLDNITGFLVKEGNHEELLYKLNLLLKNKQLSIEIGKEGRRFVETTFDWQKIAGNFLKNIKPYINDFA